MKWIWWSVLWLRQILFYVYMVVITVVMASLTVICYFLRLPLRVRLFMSYSWSNLARLGCFIFLWQRLRVLNRKNVLRAEPCVYIVKHQSSWETMILHGFLYHICFVLKQELLRIPFLGWGLKAVDSIPIDRSQNLKSFKKVIAAGKDRLELGLSIVIFPEGTRVAAGQYPKFHKTAMSLAKSTGAKVVPVAHNSGLCWPRKFGLIKPGSITLSFGEMVSPKEMTIDELNSHCYQWINTEVKRLGG
ncbi:MAG: lysophospholipid acyltransferase family protein [Francisellaceae bacterium]